MAMKRAYLWFATVGLFMVGSMGVHAAGYSGYNPPYPRLMGMNIGAKNYDDPAYQRSLSRLNLVILGFYPGWKYNYTHDGYHGIRAAVKALKDLNPDLLVGQYTVLNEVVDGDKPDPANSDKVAKLDAQGWWLQDADGKRVRWTNKYGAYDINITNYTRPDAEGRHWPQWLAERDNKKFFEPVPEFDIWYFDNVFGRNRIKDADWKQDGAEESSDDPDMLSAHQNGHLAEWHRARQLQPHLLFMGNVDNDLSSPVYRDKLQGAFLEGLMGKSWSIERQKGWDAMMQRYHDVIQNTLPPRLVGFNVAGRPDDYRFFRYAFTSSLMDNGYFSFTDENRGYSSVPWFDEYNVKLGHPLQAPRTAAWKHGVYRRIFANGLVLVNPTWHSISLDIGPGYRHFSGSQDPDVNDGRAIETLTIPAKDGVVLVRR